MRLPSHPGDLLREELEALGMTPNALSIALRVSASRIDQIVKGKRAVTPETALRLAAYFGGSPQVWLNMQSAHDLAMVERDRGEAIKAEVRSRVA